MIKIAILIGSTRPGRQGEAVARWVYEIASRRSDAQIELVDLKDFPLPHFDETMTPDQRQYSQPHTSAWGQGYATELVQRAVSLARTYLQEWPVIARTRANNLPSLRTAQRAGLIRRPDLDTEHVIFALGW